MENYMNLEFPALACNEGFARIAVAGFVMELDPTCEELSELKTAISEAVTNAIIHGYRNSVGVVKLSGNINGKEVIFTVSDFGTGIENISRAMEPLYTGAPEMERSGMGFTIMEEFMDNISVESEIGKGTVVVMSKYIRGGSKNNG